VRHTLIQNNIDTNVGADVSQAGYDALINSVILAAIDDLGQDAVLDEGTLNWIGVTNLNVNVLTHAINTMPQHDGMGPYKSECCKGKIGCRKGGMSNPKLAIRRVMEGLDARDIGKDVAEIEVRFEQVNLDDIAEPTEGELVELENDLVNMTWESE